MNTNNLKLSENTISLPKDFVKGKVGEKKIKMNLYDLPENEYLMLNDVMLRNGSETAQIDHLIFSKYGIFVIETKNFSGLITGSSKDKNWVRHDIDKKRYIHNPVLQNYGHVKFLEKLLDISEEVFIPLVCICGKCKLDVDWDKTVKLEYLVDRIKFFKEIRLLKYKDIYEKVKEMNILDLQERKRHVADKKIQVEFKTQKSINKCPKCGASLKKRTGTNGEFLGCSRYPRCKYTENIK